MLPTATVGGTSLPPDAIGHSHHPPAVHEAFRAFWPYEGTSDSIFSEIGAIGKVPVALYQDHGGSAADGMDGYRRTSR